MATISKGIRIIYGCDGAMETMYELTNLQEIPELGGDTDAIEITTFADAAHTYTDGIKNYGDSLTFKFLYEKEQFEKLQADAKTGNLLVWRVKLPDNLTCFFNASHSVKLDGVGVNAALTYTLSLKPISEMRWETSAL